MNLHQKNPDIHNIFAFDAEHKPVCILEGNVKSGKCGYYCMGCLREMQAVISKTGNRKSYFRHHPNHLKPELKCFYSDESYRHKLVIDFLIGAKKIKVPPVIKYPTLEEDGSPYIISPSKFIEAEFVRPNITFYEDENGQVCWDKEKQSREKYLVFRPDVVFLDKSNQPILLIEIEATHKVSLEKLLKIKRIGINAINITIPQAPPNEILQILSHTNRTKWLYNNEESNSQYVPVSSGVTTSIPEFDEIQRELFEETFKCRQAEIRDVIRSIERCLESQLYNKIESAIRSELSRIKKHTSSAQGRLEELFDGCKREIEKSFERENKDLEQEERRINSDENNEQIRIKQLEERYYRKRTEIKSEEDRIGSEEAGVNEEERRMEEEEADFRRRITDEEHKIEREESDIEREQREILQYTGTIQSDFERMPEKEQRNEAAVRIQFESKNAEEDRILRGNEEYRAALPGRYSELRTRIEDRYKSIRGSVTKAIENRSDRSDTEFDIKLQSFFKGLVVIEDYRNVCLRIKKLREARNCLTSASYKTWI